MTNTSTQSETSKPIVLITGSSGLIGTKLIERLADSYHCIGLDKKGNPYAHKKMESINLDITDPESIQSALNRVSFAYGNRIASVIHLAAYYDFSGEPSDLYEEVTVKGTEKLLTALESFEVEQFVFSSTNLVYAPTQPGHKIVESDTLKPGWDYPQSKVKTEKIIHEKHGDIPVVILRLAGVYDEKGHSIPISHQIQRINEKQLTSHFYPGDLLHGNVFIHLDDLVSAFVKTIENRKKLASEAIFNISEHETYSYEELQDTIGKLIHGKEDWKTFEIPGPLAKIGAWAQDLVGDPFIKPWMVDRANDHYELDISKAENQIDWHPSHRLIDELPGMIRDLKNDPDEWYDRNNLN